MGHPDRSRQVNWTQETLKQVNGGLIKDHEAIREWTTNSNAVRRDPAKQKALEEALDRKSLPDNALLYRKDTIPQGDFAKMTPGHEYVDTEFRSTTYSKGTHEAFSGAHTVEMMIPKGSPAVDTSIGGLSKNSAEREVLVNRNQRYRVVSKEGNRVRVELIPGKHRKAPSAPKFDDYNSPHYGVF